MNDRTPWIVVGALLTVVVVAVVVVLLVTGRGNSTAVTIDGDAISQSTVNNDLASLAGNAELRANFESGGQTLARADGSVSSDFTSTYLTRIVEARAINDELERRDLTIDPHDRAQLSKQAAKSLEGLTGHAQDVLLTTALGSQKLTDELGADAADAAIAKAVRRLQVSVDPRYGFVDRRTGQVCAPTGCSGQGSAATPGG
jgi:hypothetical protein